RDAVRVQATEEAGDEIDSRRVTEQHTSTRFDVLLQEGGHGAGPLVELPVRECGWRPLAVGQKGVAERVRLRRRPEAEKLDEVRKRVRWIRIGLEAGHVRWVGGRRKEAGVRRKSET